jgi:molybdenum cofactor cytidylyltransferase
MTGKVIAIVLAAGRSSRMGAVNKLVKIWRGKPVLSHVVDGALNSRVNSVIVVTGHEAGNVADLLDGRVQTAHNPDFSSGMASSVRVGLKCAESNGAEAVLILLGDMPLITNVQINAVLDAAGGFPDGTIIQATDGGKPGHPVLLPKCYFRNVLEMDGDQGAKRVIIQNRDRLQQIEIGKAALRDFDTPEDFDDDAARDNQSTAPKIG